MELFPDEILEMSTNMPLPRSAAPTTSYTTTGSLPQSGSAAAHQPEAMELIEEDPFYFDFSEFDFPELLSPEVVNTVVAVVPTARLDIPKLTSIDNLFEWMEDVRKYVILAEQKTPAKDIAVKLILSIGKKDDPTLVDFKTLLNGFRPPRIVEDSVKSQVMDPGATVLRDRTPAELLAEVTKRSFEGNSRVGIPVIPPYVKIERSEMIWEWLEVFVEGVYLDEARVNHYKDLLAESYIVLPPLKEGLPAANTAFNAHVVKIRNLLRFSKTRGRTARKRALVNTLRKDQHLYREATRGNNWEEVLQFVKRELDSRVSSFNMGHIPNVSGVNVDTSSEKKMELDAPSTDIPIQALISALNALGYSPPQTASNAVSNARTPGRGNERNTFRMRRGRGGNGNSRNSRRGPYNGRGPNNSSRSANSNNSQNGQNGGSPPEGNCFWCDNKGHTISSCQFKQAGLPAKYPNKPKGMSWKEHKAAQVEKK